MMRCNFLALCFACLYLPATADAPAAATLPEMLSLIKDGTFANNFFDGEVLKGAPQGEKEEVAGCILDKIGAIVEESGVDSFVNDLQVDLAACCTKDTQACTEDVAEAYKLLHAVSHKQATSEENAGKVAALLIKSAGKRVEATKVKESHSHYLGKCQGAPEACSIESLKSKAEL
eukprot:TRINITY_DN22913_c0_g1_i2.p1 TRINITY_DN22913_c0_g1~~TRINITY_DN22913_c0_g1_i2.p1  ORF type:complete len:175 (-),score=48.46 TRINITY_DN22913_c0_g1_i2:126-650(-)